MVGTQRELLNVRRQTMQEAAHSCAYLERYDLKIELTNIHLLHNIKQRLLIFYLGGHYEKNQGYVTVLGIISVDFYLLPMVIKDTGTAMLMLLIVVPLICFICSLIYGLIKPFSIFYSAIVAFLFIPCIFIFYNSSAWVYIIAYGIIALIGSVIGMYISKRTK